MNERSPDISTAQDLIGFSWNFSVLYFQVYQDKPDPAFYRHLPKLDPHEHIIEIRAASAPSLQAQLEFKGRLPFFGAVAGGWSWGLTDKPEEASETAVLARKHAVLPEETRRDNKDEDITLEGPPSRQ